MDFDKQTYIACLGYETAPARCVQVVKDRLAYVHRPPRNDRRFGMRVTEDVIARASPPEVVLVTTTGLKSARIDELGRLFDSVDSSRSRAAFPFRHVLLLQQCDDREAGARAIGAPDWLDLSVIDRQIPLSEARNRLLDTLLAAGVDDDAVVLFPDDDAWYPDGTLDHILTSFAADPTLDLWFCRYGSQARFDPAAVARPPRWQQILSYASSNTTVLRGRTLKAIGGFDETLGLGTPAKSGEDTDFALRAHLAARKTLFVDARMIGHRDFTSDVRAKYYAGSLLAIARHARHSGAGVVALLRKLGVGAVFCARGDLSFAELRPVWGRLLGKRNSDPAPSARPSAMRTPFKTRH